MAASTTHQTPNSPGFAPAATPNGVLGSSSFRSAALTNTAVAIKAGGGTVSAIHVGNVAASAVKVFLHLYDALAANVTVGTTTPTRSYEIAAASIWDKAFPIPLGFTVGITAAITTTAAGGTAAGVLPELVQLEFA